MKQAKQIKHELNINKTKITHNIKNAYIKLRKHKTEYDTIKVAISLNLMWMT